MNANLIFKWLKDARYAPDTGSAAVDNVNHIYVRASDVFHIRSVAVVLCGHTSVNKPKQIAHVLCREPRRPVLVDYANVVAVACPVTQCCRHDGATPTAVASEALRDSHRVVKLQPSPT